MRPLIYAGIALALSCAAQAQDPLPSDHPAYKMPTESRILCAIATDKLDAELATEEHRSATDLYNRAVSIQHKRDEYYKAMEEHFTAVADGSAEVALGMANSCVLKIDPAFAIVEANPRLQSGFECLAGAQSLSLFPASLARLEFDLRQLIDQTTTSEIAALTLVDTQIENAALIKDFGPKQREYETCAYTKDRPEIRKIAYKDRLALSGETKLDWLHTMSSARFRQRLVCAGLELQGHDLRSSSAFLALTTGQRGKPVSGQAMWESDVVQMSDTFLDELSEWLTLKIGNLPAPARDRMLEHCKTPNVPQ